MLGVVPAASKGGSHAHGCQGRGGTALSAGGRRPRPGHARPWLVLRPTFFSPSSNVSRARPHGRRRRSSGVTGQRQPGPGLIRSAPFPSTLLGSRANSVSRNPSLIGHSMGGVAVSTLPSAIRGRHRRGDDRFAGDAAGGFSGAKMPAFIKALKDGNTGPRSRDYAIRRCSCPPTTRRGAKHPRQDGCGRSGT